jgi:hypothetical protein
MKKQKEPKRIWVLPHALGNHRMCRDRHNFAHPLDIVWANVILYNGDQHSGAHHPIKVLRAPLAWCVASRGAHCAQSLGRTTARTSTDRGLALIA